MAKKNPIIQVPKGMIKANEELRALNKDVLRDGNNPDSTIIPQKDIYVTQTGRLFKVNNK